MPRISCVICAYNEAPRIAAVLEVASSHPLIDEVIVVDDGSTDQTSLVIEGFPKIKLITLPTNKGKSFALAEGIDCAQNELLLFLDADLRGLSAEDISNLARPVLAGRADISLSLRRNSLLIFRAIGLDIVTGERVVRKRVLVPLLAELRALPRFGAEVFMNAQIISSQLSITVTHWPRVDQARKAEKMGRCKGWVAELRMLGDLLRVAGPAEVVLQAIGLLRLRADNSNVGTLKMRLRRVPNISV